MFPAVFIAAAKITTAQLQTPVTPGSTSRCRISAGLVLTLQTALSYSIDMSLQPLAATTRTCPQLTSHDVFRGKTSSELYVAVHLEAKDIASALSRKTPIREDWSVLVERIQQPSEAPALLIDLQQMQQQQ